jgi:hypothetical protein
MGKLGSNESHDVRNKHCYAYINAASDIQTGGSNEATVTDPNH